jgi:hypothetical protein
MNTNARCRTLVLFLCTFTLFFAPSCSRTPAGSIEHVNECVEISNAASRLQGDAAKAGYVADHFQALDTSGCPMDFRAAFQAHVNAWRQAQMAFANNTLTNNFIEGAIAGFSGNTSNVGNTMGAASEAGQDINSTYYQLTTVAAAYGARIPRSVVE